MQGGMLHGAGNSKSTRPWTFGEDTIAGDGVYTLAISETGDMREAEITAPNSTLAGLEASGPDLYLGARAGGQSAIHKIGAAGFVTIIPDELHGFAVKGELFAVGADATGTEAMAMPLRPACMIVSSV